MSMLATLLASISAVFAFSFGSSAIAAQTDQAGIAKLMDEVRQESTFYQTTSVRWCPSEISLVESDYLLEQMEPSDVHVVLMGKSGETFTHEGNSMTIRPNQKLGSRVTLFRDLAFVTGVSYSSAAQTETQDTLTTEYSARIGSVAMIAAVNFRIKFDATAKTIEYRFTGTGVEPVICTFAKKI